MGYSETIKVHKGLGCFTQGETEIDMQRETESHDVGIIFTETERRSILRQIFKGYPEEINIEFTVEIVEFIIALPIRRIRIYFFQVVLVVRAVLVDALPDDKELPAFNRDK